MVEPIPSDIDDLAHEALRHHVDAATRAETAREGLRRAAALAADDIAAAPTSELLGDAGSTSADAPVTTPIPPDPPELLRQLPPRLRYPRWGWREAIRFAVRRRMYTPEHLASYRRFAWHKLRASVRGHRVDFLGMVFTGKRVEFHARPGHGRIVLGPWCWIGNDNKLRAHEGQLTLGAKVVMGRDNVINTYLDIEIGYASILADWIYVVDFDHRYDRLDLPIKDQGIVASPVRVGPDVWIGEKASILRGVDIGQGSVVASHCVVNKDIPPFSIAVGVPARVVKSRLPKGMSIEEAAALVGEQRPIPGDPLEA